MGNLGVSVSIDRGSKRINSPSCLKTRRKQIIDLKDIKDSSKVKQNVVINTIGIQTLPQNSRDTELKMDHSDNSEKINQYQTNLLWPFSEGNSRDNSRMNSKPTEHSMD